MKPALLFLGLLATTATAFAPASAPPQMSKYAFLFPSSTGFTFVHDIVTGEGAFPLDELVDLCVAAHGASLEASNANARLALSVRVPADSMRSVGATCRGQAVGAGDEHNGSSVIKSISVLQQHSAQKHSTPAEYAADGLQHVAVQSSKLIRGGLQRWRPTSPCTGDHCLVAETLAYEVDEAAANTTAAQAAVARRGYAEGLAAHAAECEATIVRDGIRPRQADKMRAGVAKGATGAGGLYGCGCRRDLCTESLCKAAAARGDADRPPCPNCPDDHVRQGFGDKAVRLLARMEVLSDNIANAKWRTMCSTPQRLSVQLAYLALALPGAWAKLDPQKSLALACIHTDKPAMMFQAVRSGAGHLITADDWIGLMELYLPAKHSQAAEDNDKVFHVRLRRRCDGLPPPPS